MGEINKMETKMDPDKLIDAWFKDRESFVIPAKPEVSKREYEDKLLAWIDVLGMSKKIMESGSVNAGAEDIITDIGKLKNCVENSCSNLRRENLLDYVQLNDGFVIVSELSCINELCEILCEIQWKILVELKLPVRGALTAGQIAVSNDPKVIIGPAFIAAHAMEEKIAIFPRILFSDEIYKVIDKSKLKFLYITDDADNLKYLDFLKYEFELEGNLRNFDNKLKVFGIKQLVKENYDNNIFCDKILAQKYGWIINKLSAFKVNVNY
jgi:hypothetical protein